MGRTAFGGNTGGIVPMVVTGDILDFIDGNQSILMESAISKMVVHLLLSLSFSSLTE